jgi:hypothetical protein
MMMIYRGRVLSGIVIIIIIIIIQALSLYRHLKGLS